MVTDENDGGDVIKSLESLNSFIHEASKIGIWKAIFVASMLFFVCAVFQCRRMTMSRRPPTWRTP